MIETTKVGKFAVPVRGHHFGTIVTMSGGEHGKRERGNFCFWTAVFAEPVKINGKNTRRIWGRAHVSLPAGDRFDRMKVEMKRGKRSWAFYASAWNQMLKAGANIKYIRPSTLNELRVWLKTHEKDAHYLISAMVGGKWVKP